MISMPGPRWLSGDASLGRWFGVDPKAGVMPYNSPYSAMMNNPVMFTDPDGECPICIPILVGAAISAFSYSAGVALSPGGFNNWNWGQFGKSLAIGAVSGVFSAGIGNAFGRVGSQGIFGELGRSAGHGLSSMMVNGAFSSEGKVSMSNFLAGSVSSLIGSGTHNLSSAAQLGSSALAGGISAEITGGDFWTGFAIGGTVAGLNHLMHGPDYEYKGKTYKSKEDLYLAILADQGIEQFGITDVLSLAAVIDNSGHLDKRFVSKNASKGTSIASKYGSKLLPWEMPYKMPTHIRNGSVRYTKVLGRFLGRMAGPVGWGILSYDVGMTFYNSHKIYNRIINEGN